MRIRFFVTLMLPDPDLRGSRSMRIRIYADPDLCGSGSMRIRIYADPLTMGIQIPNITVQRLMINGLTPCLKVQGSLPRARM
jgi:hypothetical protein